MTRLDDLTKEVVEELKSEGDTAYAKAIESFVADAPLLGHNFASVACNAPGLLLQIAVDPMALNVIQALMYLSFKVGEKKGRGDMLEELCGGGLE